MKNSGIPLSSLPANVQAQVRALIQPQIATAAMRRDAAARGEGPAIRQRQGPALNKTEAAFLENLGVTHPLRPARVQDVTLRLGNGVRYTPDFFLDPVLDACEKAVAFEVKGFMRDDAAVKLKVAARAFPWIRFYLVSRRGRAHPWRIVEVLP